MNDDPLCICGHPRSMHDTGPMLMGCDGRACADAFRANRKVHGASTICCCVDFIASAPPTPKPESGTVQELRERAVIYDTPMGQHADHLLLRAADRIEALEKENKRLKDLSTAALIFMKAARDQKVSIEGFRFGVSGSIIDELDALLFPKEPNP